MIVLVTLSTLLGGCSIASEVSDIDPVPASPTETETETEPQPQQPAAPGWDFNDPCSLFTGAELAEAMGIAAAGPLTLTGTNANQAPPSRPHCDWLLTDDGRSALKVEPGSAIKQSVTLNFVRDDFPKKCWAAQCDNGSELLESWLDDRIPVIGRFFEPVRSPELLAGAVSMGPEGMIYFDESVRLNITVWGCSSPACTDAVTGIQRALDAKFG